MVTIYRRCPFCDQVCMVPNVNAEGLDKWQNGALIQDAFPDLTSDQCEIIKTGICPKCWDEMEEAADEEDGLSDA
jgi:hypothetical protein